jgi:uncharacterized membrane protein YhiD involved in acid resistance
MFIFRMIAGSGFGQWFGANLFKIIVIAVVGFFLWWVYSFVNTKFEQLDQLKVQVVQQAEIIDKISKEAEQKKLSDKVTLDAVVNLQENMLKLNDKFKISTAVAKKKITDIDASNLPEKEKRTAKSTVYIDDLNESFCLATGQSCVTTP